MGLYSRFNKKNNNIDARLANTLNEFINRSDNRGKCCECGSPSIKFISITFHCILCSRCGNAHLDILPDSSVKSTQYTDEWSKEDVRAIMKSGGNKQNNSQYNSSDTPFPYDADIDKVEVENFLYDKYIAGKYMLSGPKQHLLYRKICKSGNYDDDYDNSSTNNNSSRNNSNRGYESSSGSRNNSAPPSLPSKPRPNKNAQPVSAVFVGDDTTSNFSEPKPALFDGSVELQPFYDQTTGQVYVDQQQYQQYQQQQQQQIVQQQMQAQQQLQNQQILSAYNQPGVYQSGVEIGPNQPQYNAIVQQQTYLQPQQQSYQQQQTKTQANNYSTIYMNKQYNGINDIIYN
ncbi:hypothetical protein ACO0SA_003086 [Hanseniaspora valbyensis]